MNVNTEYCSDMDGSQEFRCQCNDGFDGKRCEIVCPLDCKNGGSCITKMTTKTNNKQWKCNCPSQFTGEKHSNIKEITKMFCQGSTCDIPTSVKPCQNGGSSTNKILAQAHFRKTVVSVYYIGVIHYIGMSPNLLMIGTKYECKLP